LLMAARRGKGKLHASHWIQRESLLSGGRGKKDFESLISKKKLRPRGRGKGETSQGKKEKVFTPSVWMKKREECVALDGVLMFFQQRIAEH